jgi:Mrp family chromosome partitioning ATPase
MPVPCFYDESLPRLVDVLVGELGHGPVSSGVVLRDASGRLAYFLGTPLSEDEQERVSSLIRSRLLDYARQDRVLVPTDAAGSRRVLTDPGVRIVEVGPVRIRYLDRRVVGADWLRSPAATQAKPPRFVFSSLKGGVGRSTAMSVVAAEQARLGRNVLVVDLDLEAPGIGSLLLTRDRRPLLGALDYLVERNLRPLALEDLEAMVGTSALTAGAGLVDVVPVVGARSYEAPQNYLAKLSRAMIEGLSEGQQPISVTDKLRGMLSELEARRSYDLVLVDARAGLAELAAGPFLGLGANVLLFGTSQPQTMEGLRFLFAHLATLVEDGKPSPWEVLKMVHAKAQSAGSHEQFNEELWELFAEFLYEELAGLEGFNFDANAPEAPHNPIPIPLDPAFADWDPAEQPSKLVDAYYARTFETLLHFVDDVLRQESP